MDEMPLVVSQLTSDIQAVFASKPPSGAVAAQKIAAAYDSYCKTGLAGGVPPLLTGTEAKRMEGPLAGALSSSSGSAAAVGAAFSSGVQAYWLSPPIPFMAPPITGVVTAVPGAGAVAGAVTGALSNVANSEATIAAQIAAALDAATKTVLVTFATPPPSPPPPATVV